MGQRARVHLSEAIGDIIQRHQMEYNLSSAEVIGVLEILKACIIEDLIAQAQDEDTDD